jgi:hypothetical protein
VSVATYDLDSVDVLRSKPYASIAYANLSVWSKRVVGAGALLLNAMNVAAEAEDDFNAWYDKEHLPALAGVAGTLAARRYRSTEAKGTHRYVAIYHLKSPDVAQSPAWKATVGTPWTARVRPHFRDRIRILTHRYVRGG